MKNKSTIILTFLCILSSCIYIFNTNYKNSNNLYIQVANKSNNIPVYTTTEQTTEQTTNNTQNTSKNLNLININTANLQTLDTLPGIGQSIAQSIIDYRTNVGLFKNIEDIKNVDRIGNKTFDKIKHLITVN